MKKRKHAITKERALQVLNNVLEEYWDDGEVEFATKKEFCETILWIRELDGKELANLRKGLQDVALIYLANLTDRKYKLTVEK